MSTFDGEAFFAHCGRLTETCPSLPFAVDVDWAEGMARRSIEELQRIRDAVQAVGSPTPPPGFPMRIPRALPGAEGVDLRTCDSPELWKLEFMHAIRDAVASHEVLQERSCALARERPRMMREAERQSLEGKDGWRDYVVFEQEMNMEIGRLRAKALAAQERLYHFKYQIDRFPQVEPAPEVRSGAGEGSGPQEGGTDGALHEVAPAIPCEEEPRSRPRWDEDRRTLYLGDQVVKKYNRASAPNQLDVIEAFQNAGWPAAVDDPFGNTRKLNQTLRNLNKALAPGTIRFRQDGTGERVIWEYAT
jgi:hypothetical protein